MNKRMVTLGSIATPKGLQTGPFGSQLKAEEYTENGVPVVMPKDIFAGKIVTDDIAYVSEEKARKLAKHMILPGDIIFPRRGDLGRIAVANDENRGWLCGTGCLRARLKENVDTNYIHQYVQLETVKQWLESNALGQTMPNLNTEIVGNLPVYLVTKREQTAIAELLSNWDEAIEKTERLITSHERTFSCLLDNLMNPKGINVTKIRLGTVLRESRIPIKKDNPQKRLSVRLHLKGIEIREYRGTEAEGATQFFERRAGQFIYGKQNIFRGAVGIVPQELDGYSSSQDIPAFDIASSIDSNWLLFYFSRPNFYKRLESYAGGSGSKRLHPAELYNIQIEAPPLKDQQRIAETLNTARREIGLLKKQAEAYKDQKRGLMQKLLTGEWRVKTDGKVAHGE